VAEVKQKSSSFAAETHVPLAAATEISVSLRKLVAGWRLTWKILEESGILTLVGEIRGHVTAVAIVTK